MTAGDKTYTTTDEVTHYLVENAPKKVKAGTKSFIERIHEDSLDPNFIFFAVVSTGLPSAVRLEAQV